MRIYHLKWPHMKHEENSIRGIRYAARHGYDAIDLDLSITRDDVIVGCHWPHPMIRDRFRDPRGRISPQKPVAGLSWEQVSRLVAGRWPRRYRISRIERLLAACARHGIIAYLEPKGDPRFELDWPWQHIQTVADQVGAHVMVYVLADHHGPAVVNMAGRYFPAKVIR